MIRNKEIRVAIYARVSTDEQAEHGFSIDAQLDTLHHECERDGKIVVGEYVDRGVSGKSMEKRYELKRMLRDAEAQAFDEVMVWKINRLARKNLDLMNIIETLNKHNVAFRSYSEKFETASPMGKFALQMMGAVSELERNTIVDNVKMGLKQRARQGKHNGKVPIGYRVTGGIISGSRQRNTRVEIVPEEAEIVRRIFDYFVGGKGFRSIANALNHDGYKTPKGNFFSSETVKSIIDNPFYVGMIRYNQYENWHERRRKGKSDSVILQKGEHEPIISQELWDKVRFIRERKEYVGTKRCHVGYLLTGLLRCPDCNGSMVASRTVNWAKSGEKVVRFYYVCGNARNKGKMACKANSILKEKAELYVHRRLQKVLTNNGILKRVVREMNQRMKVRRIPLEKELQGIEQKIEQTEKSKAKYFTLFDKDAIDKEVLARRMEELATECNQLKHRKYDIEELLLLDTTTEQVSAEYVKGLLTKLDQLMENAEFDKKKALLRMVIKRITLENKRIKDIELQFDEKAIQHFFEVDPSAQAVEGSFDVQKSRSKRRFVSITLII